MPKPPDLASRLREAAEGLGGPRGPQLQQAARGLGPEQVVSEGPEGGTSWSRVPGQPGSTPYFDRPSQAVAELGYDYNNKDLTVTYTSGGRYVYHGVSMPDYTGFETASSKGFYVNKVIKPKYKSYKRIG